MFARKGVDPFRSEPALALRPNCYRAGRATGSVYIICKSSPEDVNYSFGILGLFSVTFGRTLRYVSLGRIKRETVIRSRREDERSVSVKINHRINGGVVVLVAARYAVHA